MLLGNRHPHERRRLLEHIRERRAFLNEASRKVVLARQHEPPGRLAAHGPLRDALLGALELGARALEVLDDVSRLRRLPEDGVVLARAETEHPRAQRVAFGEQRRLHEHDERRARLDALTVAREDLRHEAFGLGAHTRMVRGPHHALDEHRARHRQREQRAGAQSTRQTCRPGGAPPRLSSRDGVP